MQPRSWNDAIGRNVWSSLSEAFQGHLTIVSDRSDTRRVSKDLISEYSANNPTLMDLILGQYQRIRSVKVFRQLPTMIVKRGSNFGPKCIMGAGILPLGKLINRRCPWCLPSCISFDHFHSFLHIYSIRYFLSNPVILLHLRLIRYPKCSSHFSSPSSPRLQWQSQLSCIEIQCQVLKQ
jgi:hypothetical protein